MKTQDVVLKLIEISKSPTPPMEEITKLSESKHPVMVMFLVYIESGGGAIHPLLASMVKVGIPFEVEEEVFWEKCKELVAETKVKKRKELLQEVRKIKCAPIMFLAGLLTFQNLSRETYFACLSALVGAGALKAGLHVDEAIKCCQQAELDRSN